MNKEEFDKAKAEENKIAQNKRGRLFVEHIIEKGFNEGADWAYNWINENIPTLKKAKKQSEDLAIALEALEKIDAHEAKAHGYVGSNPSFAWEITSRVLPKIRGEL